PRTSRCQRRRALQPPATRRFSPAMPACARSNQRWWKSLSAIDGWRHRIREHSARVNDYGFSHRHKDSQTQPQSSGIALVMTNRIHPPLVHLFAALVGTVSASAAMAGDTDPTFGSRTDKPDGSSALTVGRRLPTPWETKVGA